MRKLLRGQHTALAGNLGGRLWHVRTREAEPPFVAFGFRQFTLKLLDFHNQHWYVFFQELT
jgi:hypothetical protein